MCEVSGPSGECGLGGLVDSAFCEVLVVSLVALGGVVGVFLGVFTLSLADSFESGGFLSGASVGWVVAVGKGVRVAVGLHPTATVMKMIDKMVIFSIVV